MNCPVVVWNGPRDKTLGWDDHPDVLTKPDALGRRRNPPWHPTHDLDDALRTQWSFDAHFVPYHGTLDGGVVPTLPRINKPSRPHWERHRLVVSFGCVVFDVDDPVTHALHLPARPEWRSTTETTVSSLPWSPDRSYPTNGGCRLIWLLPRLLDPDAYENLVARFLRRLLDHGIAADDKCRDWTRCYRLPHVVRSDLTPSEIPTCP